MKAAALKLSPHLYLNLCRSCVRKAVLETPWLEASAPKQLPELRFLEISASSTSEEIEAIMNRPRPTAVCEWCGLEKQKLAECWQDVEFHDVRAGERFYNWLQIKTKNKPAGTVYACPICKEVPAAGECWENNTRPWLVPCDWCHWKQDMIPTGLPSFYAKHSDKAVEIEKWKGKLTVLP